MEEKAFCLIDYLINGSNDNIRPSAQNERTFYIKLSMLDLTSEYLDHAEDCDKQRNNREIYLLFILLIKTAF